MGRQDDHRVESYFGLRHNGLALTKQKTFLLACTEEHGAILELDLTGKQLRRWDADKNGKPFEGGINDIVVTANGGAYATVFGPANPHPLSRGKNSMNPKNFFGSPYHDGICGFEPVDSGVTGSPGSLDTSSYRSR